MINRVTVAAEALRWCPAGFRFTARIEDVPIALKLQGVSCGAVEAWDALFGGSIEPLSTDIDGYVDPAKYEAAVVAAIREMLPECTAINKHNGELTALMSMNTGHFPAWIPISADPRPWGDEYTIDLEGE